jgi:hypothetical protein
MGRGALRTWETLRTGGTVFAGVFLGDSYDFLLLLSREGAGGKGTTDHREDERNDGNHQTGLAEGLADRANWVSETFHDGFVLSVASRVSPPLVAGPAVGTWRRFTYPAAPSRLTRPTAILGRLIRSQENPAVAGVSSKAAEGIRTLDLLHGKRLGRPSLKAAESAA